MVEVHSKAPKTREAVSLDNCDKEPIHIPGNIQSFAVLIATDAKLGVITYCSDNAADFFGDPAENILGKSLTDILDREIIHNLNNVLCLSSVRVQRERVTTVERGGVTFEIWAHLSGDTPVLEFEKVQEKEMARSEATLMVRSLLGRLGGSANIENMLNEAVIGLRSLSGFDRVMLYQFDQDGDGEVKAEARGPQLVSFLNHRFPKWDIPQQARDMLLKVPLRLIADVQSVPVPLLQHAADAPPLDMSLAASRGQSPIHNQYLKNMDVNSTMTLSIIVEGALWGMFSFHNATAHHVGPSLRGASELFAQFFSLQMEQRIQNNRNIARAKALEQQSVLMAATDSATSLTQLIENIAAPFCELVNAEGLAIISPSSVSLYGHTPDENMARAIGTVMLAQADETVVTTQSLKDYGFEASPIGGAMGIVINQDQRYEFLFFRNEVLQSTLWAGAPEKQIIDNEGTPRLMPRGSFETYIKKMDDMSPPWEPFDIVAAGEIRKTILRADAALARRLSSKEERQRSIYIAELNHRVRNILALIRSLSRRAKESSHSLESYAKALEQRITALGAAHDLAANQISSGVSITEIFETEVKPYKQIANNTLVLTGEKFVLKPEIAPIFALITHELMTNCVKYGAFSVPDGNLHIDVKGEKNGITITWEESGGPVLDPPTRRGFGLGLIENAIPYEMDGDSEVQFLPEGLKVKFWLPDKIVTPLTEALNVKKLERKSSQSLKSMTPENVLVVEDSMMVAIDMAEMLRSLGVAHIDTCATVAQAKRSIEGKLPDFAVLDINLRNEKSFEVAQMLREKNVPFCFATGYGSAYPIPETLQDELRLTKPVDLNTLSSTLKKLYR